METTEHIVESYVRHVLGWFTNSNVKAKGGKEIDIIAIDKNGKKYHIECGVTHKKHWALKARASKNDFLIEKKKTKVIKKWRHRNSVDFFIKEKFNDKRIADRLKDFGFKRDYKKIIVVWQVAEQDVHSYSNSKNIEIWELKDKVKDLMNHLGETYYSDDILRTLQLINKVNNESIKKAISSLEITDRKTIRKVKKTIVDVFKS